MGQACASLCACKCFQAPSPLDLKGGASASTTEDAQRLLPADDVLDIDGGDGRRTRPVNLLSEKQIRDLVDSQLEALKALDDKLQEEEREQARLEESLEDQEFFDSFRAMHKGPPGGGGGGGMDGMGGLGGMDASGVDLVASADAAVAELGTMRCGAVWVAGLGGRSVV